MSGITAPASNRTLANHRSNGMTHRYERTPETAQFRGGTDRQFRAPFLSGAFEHGNEYIRECGGRAIN